MGRWTVQMGQTRIASLEEFVEHIAWLYETNNTERLAGVLPHWDCKGGRDA